MKLPPASWFDANEIYPNLWQGSLPPGGRALAKKGFDVVVLLARENQDIAAYRDIEVIAVPTDDDVRPHRAQAFFPIWEEIAKSVVDRIKCGKKVLVTCMAGSNRSGIVVALAVKLLTNKTGDEIIEHMRSKREFALNNDIFAEYVRNSK